MAKKESVKQRKKASLPLLPVVIICVLSALIGIGTYYLLNFKNASDSKAHAHKVNQQVADIVNDFFTDVEKQSELLTNNSNQKINHVYTARFLSSNIPPNLTYSEQDYVNRAFLNPTHAKPELTLTNVLQSDSSPSTSNQQTLSLIKPLPSGEYLFVRWSLDPLKQKIKSITSKNTHVALYQKDNLNTEKTIQAFAINEAQGNTLDKLVLNNTDWSIQTTYREAQSAITPFNAGILSGLGILFSSILALVLLNRKRHQNQIQDVPQAAHTQQPVTTALFHDNVSDSVSETANPAPEETPLSSPAQPSIRAAAQSTEKENAHVESQLDSSPQVNEVTKPQEHLLPLDNTNTDESSLIKQDADDSIEITPSNEENDLNNTTDEFAELEASIKSDNQDTKSHTEFKAPVIPEVGELTLSEANDNDINEINTDISNDSNIIEFEGFSTTDDSVKKNQDNITAANHTYDVAALFRTFDIRGHEAHFTAENIDNIAKGLATILITKGQYHIVVGRDVRKSSARISNTIIETFVSLGIRVVDIGIVTTPLMVFAANNSFGCGIIITASHNPEEFNGLKWIINNESPTLEDVKSLKNIVITEEFTSSIGKGSVQSESFNSGYTNAILGDILLADLPTVVIDTMHGATAIVAPDIIEQAGCVVHTINNNVDGNFTSGNPNPTERNRLTDLSNAVINKGADIGIAFDCDGDRLAVINELGEPVSSEQLICIFSKILLETNPASDIAYDIKCSRHVANAITSFGGRPILRPTGSQILRQTIKESPQTIFAGELSGHFIFNDGRLGNYDDAIYSALRLLEWLTQTGMPLSSHLKQISSSVSTDDVYIPTNGFSEPGEKIKQIINHWNTLDSSQQEVHMQTKDVIMTSLDGFRLDFPDGFGIIRTSNTENAFTVRFSADNSDSLIRIKQLYSDLIRIVDAELAESILNI